MKSSRKKKRMNQEVSFYLKDFCCNFFVPILTFIVWASMITWSQLIWEKSLVTCNYDIIVCLKWLKDKFFDVIGYILLYTLLHSLVLITAILSSFPWLKYSGIALASVSFFYRIWTSNGFSTVDHSKANVQICLFFFLCMMLMFVWFYWLFRLMGKNRKYGTIYLAFWFTLWGGIYYSRFARSCDHLQDALSPDVKYSENGGECKWVKGSVCWHYTIEGLFKIFYWGRTTCEVFEDDFQIHRET